MPVVLAGDAFQHKGCVSAPHPILHLHFTFYAIRDVAMKAHEVTR